MTMPRAARERDAIIIPFPLHRVGRSTETPEVGEAHVSELGPRVSEVLEDERSDGVSQDATPRQKRKAHNVAIHALAGRGQSRYEIEQRLHSRELPAEVIAEEVEALERVGFLDDTHLAEELVDKYAIRGGLGRRAVAEKLRARHLSSDIIEQALSVLTDDDEREALRAVAESKARSLRSLDPVVAKRRLAGVLLRKGFNPSDVYAVVTEVLA